MTRNPARLFLCEMVSTDRAGNEGSGVTVNPQLELELEPELTQVMEFSGCRAITA